jgi:hypothetical protein
MIRASMKLSVVSSARNRASAMTCKTNLFCLSQLLPWIYLSLRDLRLPHYNSSSSSNHLTHTKGNSRLPSSRMCKSHGNNSSHPSSRMCKSRGNNSRHRSSRMCKSRGNNLWATRYQSSFPMSQTPQCNSSPPSLSAMIRSSLTAKKRT